MVVVDDIFRVNEASISWLAFNTVIAMRRSLNSIHGLLRAKLSPKNYITQQQHMVCILIAFGRLVSKVDAYDMSLFIKNLFSKRKFFMYTFPKHATGISGAHLETMSYNTNSSITAGAMEQRRNWLMLRVISSLPGNS
jgi:hypothetical protein